MASSEEPLPFLNAPLFWFATGGGEVSMAAEQKHTPLFFDLNLRILGEGLAGAFKSSARRHRQARGRNSRSFRQSLRCGALRRTDLMAAEIGLAGVRRQELRARMHDALKNSQRRGMVVGDADIALYGATEGEPGLIVIAGTGSICCGINARGKKACAGGWGPIAATKAVAPGLRDGLRAIAHAADGRGPATSLSAAACTYFHVSDPNDLSTAIYAPTITNESLAGFGKFVIEAAKAKDRVAREILLKPAKNSAWQQTR